MKHRTRHLRLRTLLLAGALSFGLGAMPSANAQTSDLELAEYYFNEGSYEQALLYLENIYKRN